jgi:hypothetical protein
MHGESLIWGLAAVAAIVLLAVIYARISRNARLRRRLRRTHGRIVSKAQRPTVKFSVKPPKE